MDDSLSMSNQSVGPLALQSLMVLSLALQKLEVGQIAIASITDKANILLDFNQHINLNTGAKVLSSFSFDYQDHRSNDLSMANFMAESLSLFQNNQQLFSHQICFIISDGKFNK